MPFISSPFETPEAALAPFGRPEVCRGDCDLLAGDLDDSPYCIGSMLLSPHSEMRDKEQEKRREEAKPV